MSWQLQTRLQLQMMKLQSAFDGNTVCIYDPPLPTLPQALPFLFEALVFLQVSAQRHDHWFLALKLKAM
eukprot:Gb_36165 [translate_table: standard]